MNRSRRGQNPGADPDRDLLLRFLAWLEVGGFVPETSEALVDVFLAEDESSDASSSDLVSGSELQLARPGLEVTLRGAALRSRVLVEPQAGALRSFVIVEPTDRHVLVAGGWRRA